MLKRVTLLFFFIFGCEYVVDSQICSKRARYMVTFTVSDTMMVTETYSVKCWLVRTCTKSRRVPRVTYRNIQRVKTKIEFSCCNGYTMDENKSVGDRIVCNPVCLPACRNGYCSSPGICSCNYGYIPDSDMIHNCKPVCDNGCEHGHCAAPNVCECDFGYKLQNGSCFPICTDPCLNGTCIAPENCECSPGYRKNLYNTCAPYCSSGCLNGTCTEPEVCSCSKGYIFQSGECIPDCSGLCTHGKCISPNVCECFDGYELQNGNCIPICDGCTNGICVAPENCDCNPGYIKSSNNLCSPHCSLGCLNGNCTEPEVCSCNTGYIFQSGACVPDCHNLCGHGTCIAPNVCECFDGYKNILPNITCQPHCSKECDHGKCIEPEICQCDEGYAWQNNACNPVCSVNCVYSSCIKPDTCECWEGYEKTDNYTCTPNCTQDCNNGVCEIRAECECSNGYKKINNQCIPICINCRNGICTHPGVCKCHPGNELKSILLFTDYFETCMPVCNNCNGTCTEPGVCTCEYPFVAVHLTENGDECDCHGNCTSNNKRCYQTVCMQEKVTSTENIFTASFSDSSEATSSLNEFLEYTETSTYKDDVLETSSELLKSEHSMVLKESVMPYWIYIIIATVIIVTIALIILITVKRRNIAKCFQSGSYPIEDVAKNEKSSGKKTEMKLSTLLKKEKEEV